MTASAESVPVVALMRGINVGSSKRIAMAELRSLLEGLGYSQVRTHLNSGNAVFASEPEAVEAAGATIEQAIAADLGVQCAVMARTGQEFEHAVAMNPLLGVVSDPSKHLVGFLSGRPDPARVTELLEQDFGTDEVRLLGREVYLWCPDGVIDSPFSKVNWEKSIGVSVTMRNWNTVRKLADLVADTR
jgi:uncharacterized protein (DUF1697 family)